MRTKSMEAGQPAAPGLHLAGGAMLAGQGGRTRPADLWIEDGRITAVGTDLETPAGFTRFDLDGKLVVPGLVDLHVHLREPGREYAETVESGTRAAAAGGFTTVCAMPNTEPVMDRAAVVAQVLERAREAGHARVLPVGAITVGQKGETLAEMLELVEAGCVAASDDGRPVASAEVMRRALEYSLAASIPVISHAEDLTLRGKGVMNEGFVSTTLGLKGIPNACEDVIVAREVLLAKLTGARVHIAHVSTRKAVQIVSRAKEDGLHVTAEASPHHLALTDEAVRGYDTHAKMNPPLRTEQDRLAVVHGLANGTIDAIATDHAPHAPVEKEVEFDVAPFGVIGLETAVGVVLTDLVAKGLLSLSRAIEAWTAGPARVLGRPAPELKVGAVADVTVLAPDRKWTVDPFKFHSKSRNSPFVGRELTGMAVLTILEGRITHEVPGLRGGTGARSRGNGGRVAVGKALR